MNFLERIDALILSFFTKISHKFQRLTGRTNFLSGSLLPYIGRLIHFSYDSELLFPNSGERVWRSSLFYPNAFLYILDSL